MKREPVMAFLLRGGDDLRPVCVGCSERLLKKGLLVVAKEAALSESQPEFSIVVYRLAEGATLTKCRVAVMDRHIGRPWGA